MPETAIEAVRRNIDDCERAIAAQKETVSLFTARGFKDLAGKAEATVGIMEQVLRDHFRTLQQLEAKRVDQSAS